ncbi:OsmC family peroxiredoxin [Pedobacter changchengzhani]|uniref:OsmC family peroxiredoxin n=2 Tax=Pedobacter changchengzhani TaxID=2529274 RepID=A0A4R5MJV5_9SPHI|nr:OsmC family peroxiredoxin [Pedobacter changchengzhani]
MLNVNNLNTNRMIQATINKQHYVCNASNGKHNIVIDEPVDLGGADSGLTPKEILMSALASCVAITLRMYIDRKGWTIEKIEVKVTMGVENAEDVFFEEITCTGSVTDDQKRRLEEIASKCPVSKILSKGNEVRTKVL